MLNRAMQEDVVAIEMLPEAEWTCPSSMILEHVEDKTEEDTEQEVLVLLPLVCVCHLFLHWVHIIIKS